MKKLYTFFVFLFALNFSVISADNIQKTSHLNHLHEIFKILGVKLDKSYTAMNNYAQTHWLRKKKQERWQMGTSKYDDKFQLVKPHLRAIGFIDDVKPKTKQPDHVLVLGATISRMRNRAQYLFHLVDTGQLTPKKITFLVSDRKLDKNIEPTSVLLDSKYIRHSWQKPLNLPKTESEAAKFIWNQLPKPACMKGIPVKFITTHTLIKKGHRSRPSTGDTINTWLKTKPKVGSIVAISNNPYVPYQYQTTKPILMRHAWFENGGTLEVVGAKADSHLKMGPLLDNVARYIYSIIQTKKAVVLYNRSISP